VRTMRPVSASQTTILHDWVDESTPATSPPSVFGVAVVTAQCTPRTRLSTG
jgi:hypothetical protein